MQGADELIALLRKALIGAHVDLGHEAAERAYAECPELKAGGRRFYEAVARRLMAEGFPCTSPSKPRSTRRRG
jgi:hypothetical protein